MSAILTIIKCIISATFKYLIHGPPQPSWNLEVYFQAKLAREQLTSSNGALKIEEMKNKFYLEYPKLPSDIKIVEIVIPNEYRINAQPYIEKLIKPYEIVIL